MSFGWAYVDCSGSGGSQAAGPVGSIQFLTGTNVTSGSSKLLYYTGSEGGGHTASSLILSGNLIVTGSLSASVINYENISIIDATGSTFFGNTNDDTHNRIGSLIVKKAGASGVKVLSASMATEAVHVRGLNVLYEFVPATSSTTAIYTASIPSYIIGVRSTGSVKIEIPAASTYGSGALLLVKDEVGHLNGTDIRLSASAAGTYTIDGATNYILTGSNPAISLYSNGANWFVF